MSVRMQLERDEILWAEAEAVHTYRGYVEQWDYTVYDDRGNLVKENLHPAEKTALFEMLCEDVAENEQGDLYEHRYGG